MLALQSAHPFNARDQPESEALNLEKRLDRKHFYPCMPVFCCAQTSNKRESIHRKVSPTKNDPNRKLRVEVV